MLQEVLQVHLVVFESIIPTECCICHIPELLEIYAKKARCLGGHRHLHPLAQGRFKKHFLTNAESLSHWAPKSRPFAISNEAHTAVEYKVEDLCHVHLIRVDQLILVPKDETRLGTKQVGKGCFLKLCEDDMVALDLSTGVVRINVSSLSALPLELSHNLFDHRVGLI